jgi:hypothetical protein
MADFEKMSGRILVGAGLKVQHLTQSMGDIAAPAEMGKTKEDDRLPSPNGRGVGGEGLQRAARLPHDANEPGQTARRREPAHVVGDQPALAGPRRKAQRAAWAFLETGDPWNAQNLIRRLLGRASAVTV